MIKIDSPFQTKKQFASVSGLTEKQVDRLIDQGHLPVYKPSSRTLYINCIALSHKLLKAENKAN